MNKRALKAKMLRTAALGIRGDLSNGSGFIEIAIEEAFNADDTAHDEHRFFRRGYRALKDIADELDRRAERLEQPKRKR